MKSYKLLGAMVVQIIVLTPGLAASFGDDVAFLKQHTDVLLLTDLSGDMQVAVSPVKCMNPIRNPERRLHLGDGYEVEPFESNRGSEFLIDLRSLKTWSRSSGSIQTR